MIWLSKNFRCASWSDKGVRRRNEDASSFDRNLELLGIADGMGGHPSGDEASAEAIRVAMECLHSFPAPERALRHAVLLAHEALARHGDNRGSTLTLCMVVGGTLHVAHAGDCRLHVDGRTITQDQGSGEMLHHFVGGVRAPEVALFTVPLRTGSWLVLTTDGVHDTVNVLEQVPRLILDSRGDLEEMTQSLVRRALRNGSEDNCTAMIAQYIGPPGTP